MIEQSSLVEDSFLQEIWAGLLVSSCSENGNDDSNLLFANILKQLTASEALLLNHFCENAEKKVSDAPWLICAEKEYRAEELMQLLGTEDIYRVDRELDHLRALQLINGGFPENNTRAFVQVNDLGLSLYIRGQGYSVSAKEYFGL